MCAQAADRPKLKMSAKHIGPIMELNAELSDGKQHLVFARNGTGKSFIARALRLLDPSLEQNETEEEIPSILVSEEANAGEGAFHLYQGETCIGGIELNADDGTVTRSEPSYIYHVFSEDFVEAHVRNRLHGLDGNITHEIIIGKENSDITDKTEEQEEKEKDAASLMEGLSKKFEVEKSTLKSDFGITGSLGAFKRLSVDEYFSVRDYKSPEANSSLDELLKQYDLYKSFPSDPELPSEVEVEDLFPDTAEIAAALNKATSPSSVADIFKDRIRQDSTFFASGIRLLEGDSHCPFCTQDLGEAALQAIDAYTSFFDDEEAKHTRELEQLHDRLERLARAIQTRQTTSLKAKARFDSLKKYFPSLSDEEAFDLSKPLEVLLDYVTSLRKAVAQKNSSHLSERMELPDAEDTGC